MVMEMEKNRHFLSKFALKEWVLEEKSLAILFIKVFKLIMQVEQLSTEKRLILKRELALLDHYVLTHFPTIL